MILTPAVRLHELLHEHPFLQAFLVAYNPKFGLLENRAMRATMGRVATLKMVATMGGVTLERLLADLQAAIERETGTRPEVQLGAPGQGGQEELDTLKAMIRRLHAGEKLEDLQAEYEPVLSRLDPLRVAEMEQQLIDEGTPPEEIQQLCDVHVALFRRSLDDVEIPPQPAGHPVHTYLAENRALQERLARWDALVSAQLAGTRRPGAEGWASLRAAFDDLAQVELHYQRKENQLFPFLEKKEFTGPSTVMWGVHDEVRALMRSLRTALAIGDSNPVRHKAVELSRALLQMVYMEEHVLYPSALGLIEPEEWVEIRRGEHEIGFAWVGEPEPWPDAEQAPAANEPPVAEGLLNLRTGALSPELVDLLIRHLPLDLSFVDEQDRVAYYSDTPHRIFPRSPGVIGRAVQKCHPPQSVHVVQRILDAFRAGEKDKARFWIELGGRFLLIEYYAVRDGQGAYRGCLEVSQDVTEIRQLTGEQRLLDWEAKAAAPAVER